MIPVIPPQPAGLHTGLRSQLIFAGSCIFGFFSVLALCLVFIALPPSHFPTNSSVTIEPGMGVVEIADTLKQEGYVRSGTMLYAFLILEHDTTNIRAGTYTFETPLTARALARHISEIGPEDDLVSLTFPEGITVADIAAIAANRLEAFDSAAFLLRTREYEGYLFPDTYFVPPNFTELELFNLLRNASEEKLAVRTDAIDAHELERDEVVILASILEREANDVESMRTVSGILQNRLSIGMALQADATIGYALDKPLSELTPDDLDLDSPYNTYLYRDLPPTPIGNPGTAAIDAVLSPIDSDYFYYITDSTGVFRYARTFDEHKQNIARYLR